MMQFLLAEMIGFSLKICNGFLWNDANNEEILKGILLYEHIVTMSKLFEWSQLYTLGDALGFENEARQLQHPQDPSHLKGRGPPFKNL